MPIQMLESGQPVRLPGPARGGRGEVADVAETAAIREVHRRDVPGEERARREGSSRGHASYRETATRPTLDDAGPARALEVMTRAPRTLPVDARVGDARDFFLQRRFRHVPLVDRDGGIRGMLSDRDLWQLRAADAARIAEYMVTRVVTASPDTTLREIARALLDYRIGAMPVVDEDQRVIGIITRSDVLRSIVERERFHTQA